MNERIIELARQAECSETWGMDAWQFNKEELTKFAELVINECAQVCKTVGAERVSNADEKYQLGREMGAEVCHNTIKHHFGIKDE